MEESTSTTTTTATTSSSCASPQTDSSSVSASPATEASNQQFRFQMKDKSVSAIEEALKTEKEFIEYVMTLPATRMDREVEETFQNQTSRTNSVRLLDGNRKVGLDHLNNLCKLMEQLSELRESNVKLKRRVQYLEDSKPLNKIHRDYAFPLMTKDDMAIVKTRATNDAYKSHTLATMSHIQKDNRERSKSAGTTELYTKSKRKFPKWSKWKEALGLDRSNQFEMKRDKDNHGKISTRQCCKELELPSFENNVERNDVSPARSLPDRNWCSATLQSSSDDVTGLSYEASEQNTGWEQSGRHVSLCLSDPEIQQDHQKRRRKSSTGIPEGNLVKGQRKKSTPAEQGELEDDLKKSTKTPWGRVKTIIQTRRDNVKLTKQKPQHRSNSRTIKGDGQTLDGVQLDNGKETNHDSDAIVNETEQAKNTERKFSLEQPNKPAVKDTLSRSISNDAASSSGQVSNLVQELQRNLSQDFSKKLEEWEKIKAKSSKSDRKDTLPKRGKSKKFERGEKSFRQRVKDINWLEKELQKVESDTQRLAKEKQKCEKRSLRLERLKEAMLSGSNKKEVFVRTSAGEFRFEGISDAFTKKLYEWETKQGVGPELSTIALLDSCLMPKSQSSERAPLKKGYSRSETSIPDASPTSPTSSPCFKHSSSMGKSTRIQLSRSNTEPDLLLYSGQKGNVEQHMSSYSTDLLCSDTPTFLQQSEAQGQIGDLDDHRETANSESNYCSLLEDNMYLLEKLRNKEEICRRLQGELEALDDRTELMAKKHQDEMERYREKLWEIHRPGRKPRDLQSSLKLISCLKTRIEELQRCSEKLKLDRETLEDSFRYHSEQQARLADGLAEKMKELQEASWSSASGTENEADRRRRNKRISCDSEVIEKLADLSTQLLQQAREVDKTLAERSRQVCHLRWELLHRDVSMMLLQTEVHRSKWQNVAAGVRRAKFRQKRSWSSSERLYPKERDDSEAEEWLQSRLKNLSTTTYSDWPKVDYGPSELVWTIHEMKKAILRLSANSTVEQPIDRDEEEQETPCRVECEVAGSEKYDLGSVLNSRSSSFSSEMSSQFCSSRPDSRLYENGRACGQRRNSLGNLSSMSGADISDSSSVNEPEKSAPCLLRLPWKTWRSKDNVSTSSDSSLMDDDSLTTSWYHARKYEFSGDEKYSDDDLWSRELNIQFTSLNEEDEESSAASREDSKLITNVTSSLSIVAKPDLKIEKFVRNEGPSQRKCKENNKENQELDRRSSDSSNEIVINKLTDTSSVKNLKVRTSSFLDLLNPKSSIKTSTSPIDVTPKVVAIGSSTDVSVGKTSMHSDSIGKVSPILPTYVQCLNISGSGSSHLISSKTEKLSNDSQLSSTLATSKITPSVTVATQKVKLSYYNDSSSKISQTSEGSTHDTKHCNTVAANSIVAEETGDFQVHSLRTEYSQQSNATCSTRSATEETAECSNCVSNLHSSNEARSMRVSDLSKLQRNRDQVTERRNAFCKQTVLLNLNSPMVKSIGNSSPSQSPTTSSPEADLSTRPKSGWLPLSIFRQK